MLFNTLSTAALLFAGSAIAAPTYSSKATSSQTSSASSAATDGFPSPNAQQLLDIEKQADGTLSNAPPPAKLSPDSIPIFQLITFNENFEEAFFRSLINNITGGVDGFVLPFSVERDSLLSTLQTIHAQEELHSINAAGVVSHFGGFVPPPCTYKFPSTTLGEAIALAETFTSVVLGTLQDAAQGLAKNGDDGPVRAVASVIGQEGEQNGFYRTLLDRKPSQKPFLTTSVAAFAFSALQDFVVSCPFDLAEIPIPIFPTITVLSGDGGASVAPRDQVLTFSVDLSGVAAAKPYVGSEQATEDGLFVTYLTGQDLPISEPVKQAKWTGSVLEFAAEFPFNEFIMEGLTIASLTTGSNFTDPDDLPAKTLAAPGLIQVNDKLVHF